jgi:hypothetical protein
MFITGVNNTGDKLFSVSTTPANNPCTGFLVITVFFYTGDKFITGVVDTGDHLLPVTKTPTINLSPVTMIPVNNYRR